MRAEVLDGLRPAINVDTTPKSRSPQPILTFKVVFVRWSAVSSEIEIGKDFWQAEPFLADFEHAGQPFRVITNNATQVDSQQGNQRRNQQMHKSNRDGN